MRPTTRRSRARATRTTPRPCASAATPTLRGGGPFSGRLTACLVFAGAVCRQILERRGITITANAVRVGQATGRELNFDMKRAILDARSGRRLRRQRARVHRHGRTRRRRRAALRRHGEPHRRHALCHPRREGRGVRPRLRPRRNARQRSQRPHPPEKRAHHHGLKQCRRHQRRHHQRHAARRAHGPAADAVDRVRAAVGRPGHNGGDAAAHQRPGHDPCLAPRAIPVMEAALACCVLDAMLDTAATI